ncbi:MAG TPA: ankyrin repeat domain-containing protein [Candidatus Limnocylindria bacterium]|nr:ankyrin repeat domain-containing protein [Candidatus Limnocylindria bacterium]
MSEQFLAAVKNGDRETVERMLAADRALARARDESGTSVVLLAHYHNEPAIGALLATARDDLDVFEAAAAGDAGRLQALLASDPALANATAPDGFSPLGLAAFFKREAAARVLLDHGADPSAPSQNAMKVTPLHSAVADGGNTAIAKMLIAAGADVNATQRHGWTPLHGAASTGDVEVVRLLLARGADPHATHDGGLTALDLARENDHSEAAALLHDAVLGKRP